MSVGDAGGPVDELANISNFEAGTIEALARTIAASSRAEEFIYREVEIDEILRLVAFATREAQSDEATQFKLSELRSRLMNVWLLVSCDHPDASVASHAMHLIAISA